MDRIPAVRILIGIFLILLACFALVSLHSYSPGDLPRYANPPANPPHNAGGAIGASLAEVLRLTLGEVAAWVAIFVILLFGLRILAGALLDELGYALLGAVLLVACASLWDSLFRIRADGLPAPGGLFAMRIQEELLPLFQPTGILLLTLFVGICAWMLLSEASLRVAIQALGGAGSIVHGWFRRRYGEEPSPAGAGIGVLPGLRPRPGLPPRPAPGPIPKSEPFPRPAEPPKPAPERPAPAAKPAPAPAAEKPPVDPLAPEKPSAAKSAPEKPSVPAPIPRKNPDAEAAERQKLLPAPAAKPAPRKPGDFILPAAALLDHLKNDVPMESEDEIQARAAHLAETLRSFRIEAEIVGYLQGPVITQFELRLAPGVKVQQIKTREEDISVAMGAPVRIEALLGGRSTIGIEVPNRNRRIVQLCELAGSRQFRECKATIPLLLAKDSAGIPLIMDLASMPHLLVAGATGSGKSVALNSILLSILLTHTPETVRLILIDPKAVEMSFYENVPHLATPVVTDMKKATGILAWAVQKMDERYDLLARVSVRNIASYNELGEDEIRKRLEIDEEDGVEGPETFLPYLVIVVDELADLIMTSSKEVENYITRLTQKSRAVGIHLVLATQRPSTDVITGLIKSNLPIRIAFRVSSQVDSRVIIDENGAEQLLGKGDMLLLSPSFGRLQRAQGAYVSDGEVNRFVQHVRRQQEPQYLNEIQRWEKEQEGGDPGRDDPLYDEAVKVVLETGRGSTSLLQRRLEIGYTRAARLVDLMAKDGVVGEYKGSQAREILLTPEEWEARKAARDAAAGDDEKEEDG